MGEAGVKWRQNGRGERSVVLKLLDDEEELGRQMLLDEEERRRQLRGGGKTSRGPVLSGDLKFVCFSRKLKIKDDKSINKITFQ